MPDDKGPFRRCRTAAQVVLLAAVLTAAGCGSDDDTTKESSAKPAAPATTTKATGADAPAEVADISGKKVTLVTCTSKNPYCGAYIKTITDELEGAGAEVTSLQNNFDATVEAQHMAQAIARRPDLIVSIPTDPVGVVVQVKRAVAAKIPVIATVGGLAPDGAELATSSLLADDEELGRIAARNLQAGLKDAGVKSGKVAVISGTAAMLITQARMKTFKEELAKTPEYKLVEVQDGNWDPVKSAQIAGSLFAKYRGQGGLQGVYAMADYMAAAVVAPAEQAGLKPGDPEGGIVITGSNCAPTGVDAIRSGKMYGGSTQSPITEAKRDARWIGQFLSGQDIPKTVRYDWEPLTKANVEQHAEECKY